MGAENLAPTGIRSPDRPSRSESLYRLSYPGPQLDLEVDGILKHHHFHFARLSVDSFTESHFLIKFFDLADTLPFYTATVLETGHVGIVT